ncbi:MAG: hypothetical protein QOH06_344 [Acidobacteriota bacterium]|jgi:hypothetical protein|nr:hypothetical protein [Acidobacteriota bacterium]
MANQKEVFSAFIDLVGIRDLARTDEEGYWVALRKFKEHITDTSHHLEEGGGGVYFFSDSAFMQADSLNGLIFFMKALRHKLLQDGLYFKASAHYGSLGTQRVEEKNTVFGHYFGRNAATLFALQERLKGIGIYVHPDRIPKNSLEKHFAYTCFLPETGSRLAIPYLDIKLGRDDLNEGILHDLLRYFFRSKSKAKKLGRFYISILVLWVQSLDLEGLNYDMRAEGELVSILLSGKFERLFGDVIGIEYIYFALLNRVYTGHEEGRIPLRLFYDARRYVLGQRRIARWLDNIPEQIMHPRTKNRCLQDLSSGIIKRPPEEKEVANLVQTLAAISKSDSEIAQELESRKLPTKSGRPWSANAVRAICREEGIVKL